VTEIAAVQRVLLLLNREELLHGRDMVVVEDAHPEYYPNYVFVTPNTFIFVFTVGLHLAYIQST
jgi:hypothetical protein